MWAIGREEVWLCERYKGYEVYCDQTPHKLLLFIYKLLLFIY